MSRLAFDYDVDDYVEGFDAYEWEAEQESNDLGFIEHSDENEEGTVDPFEVKQREHDAEEAGLRPLSARRGDLDFFEEAPQDEYDDQHGAALIDWDLPVNMSIPNQWELMEDHNIYYAGTMRGINRGRRDEYYEDHEWQKYKRREQQANRWRNPTLRERLLIENRQRMKKRYYGGYAKSAEEALALHETQKERARLRQKKRRARLRAEKQRGAK